MTHVLKYINPPVNADNNHINDIYDLVATHSSEEFNKIFNILTKHPVIDTVEIVGYQTEVLKEPLDDPFKNGIEHISVYGHTKDEDEFELMISSTCCIHVKSYDTKEEIDKLRDEALKRLEEHGL